jgi:hypothetical protein
MICDQDVKDNVELSHTLANDGSSLNFH